jgi:hypothetical protein
MVPKGIMIVKRAMKSALRETKSVQQKIEFAQLGIKVAQQGIKFGPRALRFDPRGLRVAQQGLKFVPRGLRFGPRGLRVAHETKFDHSQKKFALQESKIPLRRVLPVRKLRKKAESKLLNAKVRKRLEEDNKRDGEWISVTF